MGIVRNKKNNCFYRYLGDDKYRNLCTNEEGFVPEEKAKDVFVINIEATYLCENFPIVETLINKLNLKSDKQ